MKLYLEQCKTYEKFRVGNTDYYIETCEHTTEEDYIEVWLYRQSYGIKMYMFGIKKDAFIKTVEREIRDYIRDYKEEYED